MSRAEDIERLDGPSKTTVIGIQFRTLGLHAFLTQLKVPEETPLEAIRHPKTAANTEAVKNYRIRSLSDSVFGFPKDNYALG